MSTPSPRRWLLWYALSFAALSAVAVWAAVRVPGYRDPAWNFYAMKKGEYFDDAGLTRRQGGSMKLGFAESFAPPPVGAFGNHILNTFGASAFGAPESAETFFNYSYANVSLPEQVSFLRDVEAHGRLPSKLMIVALTPPNADNGHFIIDHGNELPPGVLLEQVRRAGAVTNPAETVGALWQTVDTWIHEIYSYNTLLLGLTQDTRASHITGPEACRTKGAIKPSTGWVSKLPWILRSRLDPSAGRDVCDRNSWEHTIGRDGARINVTIGARVVNVDPLSARDRGLHAGDEKVIAAYLRTINDIGVRNHVPVVFIITPVLEIDRHDSVVNQVMDHALALVPDLTVVDDRNKPGHDNPEMFESPLHPAPAYFANLVAELRKRGLLDTSVPVAPAAVPTPASN